VVGLQDADLELLALAQESRTVLANKESPALEKLALLGGSPQGARPKVLVHYDAAPNTVSTDPRGAGTPWLVKFQARGEHKEVCAVEARYAQLARACGLVIPHTRYFDLDAKLAGFGVEGFGQEEELRVPVHSLAGALHADIHVPAVDYGTFLRCARAFTEDEREMRKGFEIAVFNAMFNNRDDHARNLSFRMNRELRWQPAPCYDLTFSEGPRALRP
jgi:serine/threonine-protein kinase HipA